MKGSVIEGQVQAILQAQALEAEGSKTDWRKLQVAADSDVGGLEVDLDPAANILEELLKCRDKLEGSEKVDAVKFRLEGRFEILPLEIFGLELDVGEIDLNHLQKRERYRFRIRIFVLYLIVEGLRRRTPPSKPAEEVDLRCWSARVPWFGQINGRC